MFENKPVFRQKPIEKTIELETGGGSKKLKRTLMALDLTALGIGAIIGTGIFVLTGVAAANYAGPAVIFSFVTSAVVAGLAAVCYAELASMVPVAGSAYSYTYTSMGEIIAWLIGWNLVLEYLVAAGAVAVGWSSYMNDMLRSVGIAFPDALSKSVFEGGILNLPAVIITLLITWVVVRGSKQSAGATKVIVGIKLAIIGLFIFLGVFHIDSANYVPFAPYGFSGVFAGAAIVFFAYIGFDAVSTAAEEVRNPKKDLPRAIILSLIISTVLYIVVSWILTGMLNYTQLNTSSPITTALLSVGIRWASAFISVGALAGLTSVLIAVLFAQSRIFFAMSRDGLLPPKFSKLHKKYGTPSFNTLLIGLAVSAIGAVPHPVHRGDGQHRHAFGIHRGRRRRYNPAQKKARAGEALPCSLGPLPARAFSHIVFLPDDQSARRHLDTFCDLDVHRHRDLCFLWL